MDIGHSAYVEAPDADTAIEAAIDLIEAERPGFVAFEIPLLVEDQGDGTFEVVVRERVAPRPGLPGRRADGTRVGDGSVNRLNVAALSGGRDRYSRQMRAAR